MKRAGPSPPEPSFLILDANVLIDYCAADRAVLTLISMHVGQIHVPSVLLEEVGELDESECERLALTVVGLDIELLAAAGHRRPGLSYYDHLCLLAAKSEGWVCVTNDGRLRRECLAEKIRILWGLEPMIQLVAAGHLSVGEARRVARTIQGSNPRFITDGIVTAFESKIESAARTTRRRR